MIKKNRKKASQKKRSRRPNEIENRTMMEFSKGKLDNAHQQMEIKQKEDRLLYQKELWQILSEIYDKSLGLSQTQFHIYRAKIQQLNQLFVEPPYAGASSEGDLPTSFVSAEKEIAKYIAECLQGYHGQKYDTEGTLSLIRDYKVVQSHPEKNHSVSLERVHSILEDNFQDSSLYKLLHLLLNGNKNAKAKVITFF
ncbi:hypothetical protein [Riemerella columbipharyngis]|uniref:Uncharacterized protein n=1 Tax=Riemerella columbipharyngis TaxID=1071918 RepID=A0A1G7CP29_9FLAO|nr:hypothetical protein [Riemerella columbipharyngis]SDE40215.1 hypothetical protein SAMN05421544_10894 [Riemerella columbipharyngis]